MLFFMIIVVIILFFWFQWKKEQKQIQDKIEYDNKIERQINQLAREIADERTEEIRRYMKSPIWEHRKNRRLKIDNYTCVICEAKENLEVHHIVYTNIGHESIISLRTVCKKCHKEIHEELGYPSYDPWDYLQGFFWKEEWDNQD